MTLENEVFGLIHDALQIINENRRTRNAPEIFVFLDSELDEAAKELIRTGRIAEFVEWYNTTQQQ